MGVTEQMWTNVDAATGTRLVRIERSRHIPRFLYIDKWRCKVWYRDQPLQCDICSESHKAADCPNKGKCLRCHQEGHMSRNCSAKPPTKRWAQVPNPAAPPPAGSLSETEYPSLPNMGSGAEAPVTAPESVEQAGPSESVDMRDNQLDEVVTPVEGAGPCGVDQISEASAPVVDMETNVVSVEGTGVQISEASASATTVVPSPDKATAVEKAQGSEDFTQYSQSQSILATAVSIEVIDEGGIPVEKEDLTQCSQSQSTLANSSQSEFRPPDPVREHRSRKEKESSRRASHSRSRSKERPGRDPGDERSRGLRHRQSPSPSPARHAHLPTPVPAGPPRKGKK